MSQEKIRICRCDNENCDNETQVDFKSIEPGWIFIEIVSDIKGRERYDFCSARCAVEFLMKLDDNDEIVKTVIVDEEKSKEEN